MTHHDLENYQRDGFVILRDYFPKEPLKEVMREARAVFDLQIRAKGLSDGNYENDAAFEQKIYELFKVDYPAFLGCAKAAQHILSLHRLALSEPMMEILKAAGLQFPTICVKPIIYFNSRHTAKSVGQYRTPAHQDWRSMQGSLNSVVVWMPLIDLSSELGPVEFMPGSHRTGLLGSEPDEWFRHIKPELLEEAKWVKEEVNQGDVVLFSAFCAHRSGNNTSERIRWSIHFRYNDLEEASWKERNYPHPYKVYHPNQEIISPGFPTEEDLNRVFNIQD